MGEDSGSAIYLRCAAGRAFRLFIHFWLQADKAQLRAPKTAMKRTGNTVAKIA